MAELMDQSEIDALLNSTLNEMDEDGGGDDAGESAEPASGGKKTKIYTYKEDKNKRFKFPYHSPVVKNSNFIMNPDPHDALPEDVPVVRTLANYAAFMKHQRTQSMM